MRKSYAVEELAQLIPTGPNHAASKPGASYRQVCRKDMSVLKHGKADFLHHFQKNRFVAIMVGPYFTGSLQHLTLLNLSPTLCFSGSFLNGLIFQFLMRMMNCMHSSTEWSSENGNIPERSFWGRWRKTISIERLWVWSTMSLVTLKVIWSIWSRLPVLLAMGHLSCRILLIAKRSFAWVVTRKSWLITRCLMSAC